VANVTKQKFVTTVHSQQKLFRMENLPVSHRLRGKTHLLLSKFS
jgi:hypothetical protein